MEEDTAPFIGGRNLPLFGHATVLNYLIWPSFSHDTIICINIDGVSHREEIFKY